MLEAAPKNYLLDGGSPFGSCHECGSASAVHRFQDKLVCRDCLPSSVVFAPFLGFQEDLWARDERYILAGGGAGPGKTTLGARLWIKQWVSEDARWRNGEIESSKGWALFMRRHIPELLQVVEDFKRYIKKLDPGADWNESKKICTLSCGYKVQFAGCEHDGDYLKYYGNEYTLLVIDEAVQFAQKVIEELDARVRCSDAVLGQHVQTVLLTNPVGSATKDYLRRRFVRVAEPRQTVRLRIRLRNGKIKELTQVYLPGNLYDNPALLEDGAYEANLLQKRSATRRALLDNDWDVQDGTWVGDDWDPSLHICEPFPIPTGWYKFKSGDYGFDHPASVQWWAVDPDDNMVCYRSLTVRGHTAEELGRRIKQIESEPYYVTVNGQRIRVTDTEWDFTRDCSTVYGPMDSSVWAKVGETGPSRGEMLDTIGCGFFKSDKSRASAAEQMRNRIRKRSPNAAGELVVPGIRWFTTCRTKFKTKSGDWDEIGPVTTIPGVLADDDRPDEWAKMNGDDDMDSAGYACLSRPVAPPYSDAEMNQRHFDELRARRESKRASSASGFPGLY